MLNLRQPIRTTGNNLVGLWRPSFVKVNHQLFVYGGGGNNLTNDLHVLDLCDMQWKKVQSVGVAPCKRYGHTATLWKQYIIVFGGCNEYQDYCNDIHLFDLEKQTWSQPEINGSVTSRYLHSAVVHDDKLFVYGGFAKKIDCTYVLGEICVLDLNTFSWSIFQRVPPRYNHSATLIGNKMFIYAGKDEQGNTVSDLFKVHLNLAPYIPHCILSGMASPMVLLKSQHFCEAVCGKLLVFGRYINNSNSKSMYQPNSSDYNNNSNDNTNHNNSYGFSHGGCDRNNPRAMTVATGGTTTSLAIQNNNNTPESMYGLWMLDLDTLEWEQQLCDTSFGVGGWNYFTVITEQITSPPSPNGEQQQQSNSATLNNLLFLGNTQFHRPQGYDHFRDALIINCESLGLYDIPSSQSCAIEFGELLNNPELSDYTITSADGLEFYVHKLILMARWPHFRQMFKSGMIEAHQGRMQIDDRSDVVLAFLRYLYTDHLAIDVPVDVLCDMLLLANMYLLHRLKKLCCQRLYENHLTIDTCTTIFSIAILTDEVGLKLLSLDFIVNHYGALLKANLFDQMESFARLEFLECIPNDMILQIGQPQLVTISNSNGNRSNKHGRMHHSQSPTATTTTLVPDSAAQMEDRMASVITRHERLSSSNSMAMGA